MSRAVRDLGNFTKSDRFNFMRKSSLQIETFTLMQRLNAPKMTLIKDSDSKHKDD